MTSTPDERLERLTARLEQLERRHHTQRRLLMGALTALALFGSSTLFAQVTWAPPGFNVFVADTPAQAAQVNANFQWLVQNPGAAFLTTGACPAGYTAFQGGQYLRLGVPNLTPAPRTLASPAHRHLDFTGLTLAGGAHTHNYNDYFWRDTGDTNDYGTPDGDGSGERVEVQRTTIAGGGDHSHTVSGRVGPASGANGDADVVITGELQHITLRLCVRS